MTPIPVRLVKFLPNVPIDVPGKNVASACVAEPTAAGKRWQIEYWPWLRSFRVDFFSAGAILAGSAMIPECHVQLWEPADWVGLEKAIDIRQPAETRSKK